MQDLTSVVKRPIVLAREAKRADQSRDHMPIAERLASGPTSERAAFRDYVDGLSEQLQKELVAVMWFGRGDFSSYANALSHSEKSHVSDPDLSIANYMYGKAQLAEYLQRGLDKIQKV